MSESTRRFGLWIFYAIFFCTKIVFYKLDCIICRNNNNRKKKDYRVQ